ncbi:hypothetical protein FQA39_LY11106 [Lamprigera yunnana]|nr:hypothetical protein FQA39_LY11106 [Lamprigera yunnana]
MLNMCEGDLVEGSILNKKQISTVRIVIAALCSKLLQKSVNIDDVLQVLDETKMPIAIEQSESSTHDDNEIFDIANIDITQLLNTGNDNNEKIHFEDAIEVKTLKEKQPVKFHRVSGVSMSKKEKHEMDQFKFKYRRGEHESDEESCIEQSGQQSLFFPSVWKFGRSITNVKPIGKREKVHKGHWFLVSFKEEHERRFFSEKLIAIEIYNRLFPFNCKSPKKSYTQLSPTNNVNLIPKLEESLKAQKRYSLKCYNCKSDKPNGCGLGAKPPEKNCGTSADNNKAYYCYYKIAVNKKTNATSSASDCILVQVGSRLDKSVVPDCADKTDHEIKCSVCASDLCNSVPPIRSSFMLVCLFEVQNLNSPLTSTKDLQYYVDIDYNLAVTTDITGADIMGRQTVMNENVNNSVDDEKDKTVEDFIVPTLTETLQACDVILIMFWDSGFYENLETAGFGRFQEVMKKKKKSLGREKFGEKFGGPCVYFDLAKVEQLETLSNFAPGGLFGHLI